MRQAQSKIGLGQNQTFDPSTVPEVLAARAAYESAVAQQRLAQADSKRYENLVNSGDVSRSAYEKARTQADTAQAQKGDLAAGEIAQAETTDGGTE